MIKNAMVIGSGVMGAQIAGHLANCGLEVLLIDIVPPDEAVRKKDRSAFANNGKKNLLKLKPAPMMMPEFLDKIQTGNIDDDLKRINEFDWVLEVIIEKSEIKRELFKKIDALLERDVIISSNTSGISIAELSDGLSGKFKKNFLGTHFFNPPRYLHLMELIPGVDTNPNIMNRLTEFMSLRLGKGVVLCKDTPNFIGNRVGVYAMMSPIQAMSKYSLTIDEVDFLTGPLIGRPKSATFRTADVVGLDTLMHVLSTLVTKLKDESEKSIFQPPEVIQKLVANKALGDKTGAGFYKKSKKDGKTVILSLDLKKMDYAESTPSDFPEIKEFLKTPDLGEKIAKISKAGGRAGDFVWDILSKTLCYAAQTVCEIAHDIQSVDEALKFGFGWEMGPFEIWDAMGVEETIKRMEKDGLKVPAWVKKHIEGQHTSFYQFGEDGRKGMADPFKGGLMAFKARGLRLETAKKQRPIVKQNKSATIVDLGDGVICLEFHSFMNSAGKEIIESIIEATQIAQEKYKALVIANHGKNFCVGANLKELLECVKTKDLALARKMIAQFQKASMSIKYCGVPVVVAAHGMALGGGCEFIMHSPNPILSAEAYIGLVEIGVGLIPAGGGTKEMAVMVSDTFQKTGEWNKPLKKAFETLGMAKVSASGIEGSALYLNGRAEVVMNDDLLMSSAKTKALWLSQGRYVAKSPRKDIIVSGSDGYSNIDLGIYLYEQSKMISAYDALIGRAIARIITGGGVSNVTKVSEEYLLELELDTFIGLLGNEKTVARIEYMLKVGSALRN
jgi:3-hydroxyacyl-CoA dehydrogenase